MKNVSLFVFLFALMLGFGGCEKKPPTGDVQEVHWDRDMCKRCKMVVSERHHGVQVIDMQNGESYMFDDIGCTVLWFDDHNIGWKKDAKIWITDVDTGKWIDARQAFYTTMNITPMAYGFAAHETRTSVKEGEEVIGYDEMAQRVHEIEAKKNRSAY